MPDTTNQTLSRDDEQAASGRLSTEPVLYLCIECDRPTSGGMRVRLGGVDEVIVGRGAERGVETVSVAGRTTLHVRVPDRRVSQAHARLVRREGAWMLEDAGSKNGILVDGHPIERIAIPASLLFEIGHTFFLFRAAAAVNGASPGTLDAADFASAPVGTATLIPSLETKLEQTLQMAKSAIPIMLMGESGTGKELIARAIHERSGRPGAFVAINCSALAPSLAESELFGYKKGAFSGAAEDRPGLVRAADQGTLFLDEIGDLPLPMQGLFLRVLQEQEVTPVGATRPVRVDLRIVSATHRNLEEMVDRGDMRADLYARLSGGTLRLPPLRDRVEDLGLLVGTLLRRVLGDRSENTRLSAAAARAVFSYAFPLNVRELEKSLAAACAVARDGLVGVEHLPEPLRTKPRRSSAAPDDALDNLTGNDLKNRERLVGLLDQFEGNISAVARQMGKGRTQIQRWIKRYGIKA